MRGRLVGAAALLALAASIAVVSITLARSDRELVPAWRLGDHATTAQVQRLADRLGIPGEVRRTPGGWFAAEGGVNLRVVRGPGLDWRAGPFDRPADTPVPDTPRRLAVRVARQLVADVGGPPIEVVGGEGGLVIMRPVVAGAPVSAMPWSAVVEPDGRVSVASGWLNAPVPVFVTTDQLRRDDRLLPRRIDDRTVSVANDDD